MIVTPLEWVLGRDTWTIRKGKMRVSWVWKMRNDHYGVKRRQENIGNEAWSKIQLCGNLELKNLIVIYTLTLRTNLEHFPESILYILYIISKLGKSEVQSFKWYTNQRWNEEVMAIWRQLHKAEGSFRNDFETQLMNSKSTSKWHQFQIHPLPLWCFTSFTLEIASRALHPP